MNRRLNRFLQVVSADIAVDESDYNRITTLFKQPFELDQISQENHNLDFYSRLFNHDIELFKKAFLGELCPLNRQDGVDRVDDEHHSINGIKDIILLSLGDQERYNTAGITGTVTIGKLYQLIFRALDKFQCFLERRIGGLMKGDCLVSSEYLIYSLKEVEQEFFKLRSKLEELDLEPELISMAGYPLACFKPMETGEKFMLSNVRYYQKFVRELYELVNRKGKHLGKRDLLETLCMLNFNTSRFYDYVTRFIDEAVSLSPTPQIESLRYFLNKVHNCQLKVKEGFRPNRESIKDMLQRYILGEIKLFKLAEKSKKTLPQGEEISRQDEEAGEEGEKIDLGLTVNAVGLLMQALKNIGVIKNHNIAEVYRVVTRSFRSRKSPDISLNSLSRKRCELTDKTRNELIVLSEDLLRHFKQAS